MKRAAGFSLVEITLVILMVGVLAGVTVVQMGETENARRFEETRAKMEAIRAGLVGDEEALDGRGRRNRFGYHGDFGALPVSLDDLIRAVKPAWKLDEGEGIGAGWRGPYVDATVAGEEGIGADKWGRPFLWEPNARPPRLVSYGADGAAGGKGYDSDIVMPLEPASLRGTVHGRGRMARLTFPRSGMLHNETVSGDSTGVFRFPGVPLGFASLSVGREAPIRVTVDRPHVKAPAAAFP